MNKPAYYLSNIVSIFFLVFGLMELVVAITSIIGTGAGMYGAALSEAMGKETGGFPLIVGLGGGLYFGFLGTLYLAASLGLYKFKSWTYLVLLSIGGIGLLDALWSLSSIQPKYMEFFWVLVYGGLAIFAKTSALFKTKKGSE